MFSAALAAAVQSDAAAKADTGNRIPYPMRCVHSGLVGRAVAVRPMHAMRCATRHSSADLDGDIADLPIDRVGRLEPRPVHL